MTVALIIGRPRFIGASTDTKPTGVAIGSTFWEYNTGNIYTTYDGTNWALYFNY